MSLLRTAVPAAQAVAAGIRRKYKAAWLARGFGARKPTEVMLQALDSAAEAGGLAAGMKVRTCTCKLFSLKRVILSFSMILPLKRVVMSF